MRQYSLANAPHKRDHYLICVRDAVDSRGGSRYLHQTLRLGDRLPASMPRNAFPLKTAARYVLVGAGIGITPLLSMAEALERQEIPFELHYFVRHRDQAAFTRRMTRGFKHGQWPVHRAQRHG